jgi:geranylgeranyl diphosphate synthase type I
MDPVLEAELVKVRERLNSAIVALFGEVRPSELYDAAMHLIKAGGKRLRPFLALKACETVGGKEEDVLPFAVALEVLHNFTLIHDDIMDRSRKRRGIPTVHTIWGVPFGITAGDLLFAKVYDIALKAVGYGKVPLERAMLAFNSITQAILAICQGQAYDLLFEKRKAVSENEYLELIRLKTASLYEASAKVGALVGGGKALDVQRLAHFGLNLGMAFQIRDDVLGVVGKEEILRKPVGDDIREGKKTVIVIHALSVADDEQRSKILSTLGRREATRGEVEDVIELLKALGAIDYANELTKKFVKKAKAKLKPFPDSASKSVLLKLADFVLTREH